ncbi:MAG TPA: alpha/beta fold hydrolase [Gaiellaceae bacterium]
MPTRTVRTADGRALAVGEGGDPAGRPVVVHHGTPSSGALYASWERAAAEQGIRLIGFDRAGYGGSTRAHGRDVAHVAGDVTAIADELGLERFATWGISGGGPHALACAALCDERLVAAASLAGVAPWDADGLDWLAGMGEGNLIEFDLAVTGEEALAPALEDERAALVAATPDQLVELLSTLLGQADRAVLTGAFAAWLVESTACGLESSAAGWVDDDLAFAKPWGFEPAAIERPVLVVQGGDDRFVPPGHGAWLAERVPGAEALLDDADGHLTLIENRVPEVHEWLLRQF